MKKLMMIMLMLSVTCGSTHGGAKSNIKNVLPQDAAEWMRAVGTVALVGSYGNFLKCYIKSWFRPERGPISDKELIITLGVFALGGFLDLGGQIMQAKKLRGDIKKVNAMQAQLKSKAEDLDMRSAQLKTTELNAQKLLKDAQEKWHASSERLKKISEVNDESERLRKLREVGV